MHATSFPRVAYSFHLLFPGTESGRMMDEIRRNASSLGLEGQEAGTLP